MTAKKIIRLVCCITAALMTAFFCGTTGLAEGPYNNYTYDPYNKSVPTSEVFVSDSFIY